MTVIQEFKMKDMLANRFEVGFGSCIGRDKNYVSVFATFPAQLLLGYESRLLGITLTGEENSLSAEEQYNFVKFVIFVYHRTFENVVTLIGDNAHMNRAFARRVGAVFLEYHSHWFNVAVTDFKAGYDTVVECIHTLIRKMSFQMPSTKFAKAYSSPPQAQKRNSLGSTYGILRRYVHRKSIVHCMDLREIQELLLEDSGDDEIDDLLHILTDVQSVIEALQSRDICLGAVLVLFDGVLENHPSTCPWLGIRSHLIENLAFESAIGRHEMVTRVSWRLQSKSRCRTTYCQQLLQNPDVSEGDKSSFAARLLKRRRLNSIAASTHYMDLRFIVPTSTICEGLFSFPKFGMSLRRSWPSRPIQSHSCASTLTRRFRTLTTFIECFIIKPSHWAPEHMPVCVLCHT